MLDEHLGNAGYANGQDACGTGTRPRICGRDRASVVGVIAMLISPMFGGLSNWL